MSGFHLYSFGGGDSMRATVYLKIHYHPTTFMGDLMLARVISIIGTTGTLERLERILFFVAKPLTRRSFL